MTENIFSPVDEKLYNEAVRMIQDVQVNKTEYSNATVQNYVVAFYQIIDSSKAELRQLLQTELNQDDCLKAFSLSCRISWLYSTIKDLAKFIK